MRLVFFSSFSSAVVYLTRCFDPTSLKAIISFPCPHCNCHNVGKPTFSVTCITTVFQLDHLLLDISPYRKNTITKYKHGQFNFSA